MNEKLTDLRILVVEDAGTMMNEIVAVLNALGFMNLEQARNGKQAIELLRFSLKEGPPFAFILSDINMPMVSGVELLKWVKSVPEVSNLPFMMLTSENEQSTVLEAIGSGADQYCIKPLQINVFEPKFMGLIRKRYPELK